MTAATNITRNIRSRRVLTVTLAFALLASAGSAAGAKTPVESARERAETLRDRVAGARLTAEQLQERIVSLSSGVATARRHLDRVQGRLLEAQHGFLAARSELDLVTARMTERVRAAFMTSGPAASATYLLGAESLMDLMDRTMMLDNMQRSDAELGAELQAEAAEYTLAQDSLERATAERGRLLAGIASRHQVLLATFAAQQLVLEQLVDRKAAADRTVQTIERRMARRAGAIPFGDWAVRFLEHMGAPTCRDNQVVVVAWQANEFTQARWNPLATTHRMAGSTSFNEVGVQNFVSLTQGLRATRETLTDGASSFDYGAILAALDRCAASMTTAEAIRASAWCRGCSNGGYVTELLPMIEMYFDRYTTLHA